MKDSGNRLGNMKRHFRSWHKGEKEPKILVDDTDVPEPWCLNWKDILKDDKILPEEIKIGRGKKTLRDGRQSKSVMHDCLSNMALNKREQKNQHKEVAKINDEILKEESSQIMTEQSYLQQPRPVQRKDNTVTLMQFLVSSAPPKEKI